MNCEAFWAAWSLDSGAKIGGFFGIYKGWGGKYASLSAFVGVFRGHWGGAGMLEGVLAGVEWA